LKDGSILDQYFVHKAKIMRCFDFDGNEKLFGQKYDQNKVVVMSVK
jgi:hypothetical protein